MQNPVTRQARCGFIGHFRPLLPLTWEARSSVEGSLHTRMSIPVNQIVCPSCQKSIEIADEHAGLELSCPTCGARLRIPGPEQSLEAALMPSSEGSLPAANADRVDVLDAMAVPEATAAPKVSNRNKKTDDEKFCIDCAAIIPATASFCSECGIEQSGSGAATKGAANNRIAAGVCGILLGALGVHKFILGYTGAGITMLLISILGFCFYGWMAMHVLGIIEGILYLSLSERDFQNIHGKRLRPWF
jgi:TM2 domain-containing membrane protein YozV